MPERAFEEMPKKFTRTTRTKCLDSFAISPWTGCITYYQSICTVPTERQSKYIVHVHVRSNRIGLVNPTIRPSGAKVPVQSGRTICHSLPSAKKTPSDGATRVQGKRKHQKHIHPDLTQPAPQSDVSIPDSPPRYPVRRRPAVGASESQTRARP